MKIVQIIGIFLLSLPIGSYGQQPFFRIHPLKESFPEAEFSCIYESSDGYLWIGSSIGLFRSDGLDHKRLLVNDSLSNNRVSAIFQDQDGIIWVGYEDGKIYLLSSLYQLELWEPSRDFPTVPITGMGQDDQGVFWMATYGQGLYYHSDDQLVNITEENGLLDNDVFTMYLEKQGKVWLATDNGLNLCSLNKGNIIIESFTAKDGLEDEIITAIIPDGAGNYWLGMHDKGIGFLQTSNRQIQHIFADWPYGPINSLELFKGIELWIGTERQGILRYNLADQKLQLFPKIDNQKTGEIFDFHLDIEGNLWILTYKQGVCSANRQFEFLDLPMSNIQSLLVDQQNRFWIGTQEGLFLRQAGNEFVQILQDIPLNVLSLYEDKYHNIWIGTFGDGLYCLEPESGSLRHITQKDGLTNESILSIAGTSQRTWLATLGGVSEFDNRQNILQSHSLNILNYNEADGLGTNFIYAIFIDSKDRTWFGTDGMGVSLLENGRITNYNQVDTIDLHSVYSITEDLSGHIWISTDRHGIFEFDGQKFSALDMGKKIPENAVTSLVTDKRGNILIFHLKGIDMLMPDTKHLMYFDKEVGIQHFEPSLNAFCKDSRGDIWIGATNSIIRYTPLNERLSIHPRTNLNQVLVLNIPIDFNKKNILSHRENFMTFDFIGLWYTDPATVKYRYQLEGLDRDWIYTKDQQVTYSNIPPGNYIFKVTSTENEVFDDEPLVEYPFTIKSPFWTRPWFIMLMTALGFGLVLLVIKFRDQQMQREADLKKEKIVSQFEALKSQINPHFLFNSFNTVISLIEDQPKQAIQYMELLSDFYRDILLYREKDIIPISEEITLVKNYIALHKERFGNNLQLKVATDLNGGFIAPLTLQLLVENAIKHNTISTAKPLLVRIEKKGDDYLLVSNNLQRKYSKEASTGFGLNSIQKRYGLLINKAIQVEENMQEYKVAIPIIKRDLQ